MDLLDIFKEQGVVDIIQDYVYSMESHDKYKKVLKQLKDSVFSFTSADFNSSRIMLYPTGHKIFTKFVMYFAESEEAEVEHFHIFTIYRRADGSSYSTLSTIFEDDGYSLATVHYLS